MVSGRAQCSGSGLRSASLRACGARRAPRACAAAAHAGGRLRHARRPDDPRVPAGGVRRCRGAPGVPRPRACAPWPTSGCTASAPAAASRASPRYADPPGLEDANAALRTMGVDLEMVVGCAGTDVVHSHTWYANLAGHVAKLLHGVPHVVTTHSLEPLRPWKAEQLGGGYALSSWVERTALEAADAVIAVSAGMKRDVLAAYPAVGSGPDPGGAQRHRHRSVPTRPGNRRRHPARNRPGPAQRDVRRPDHPPEGPAVPVTRGEVASGRRATRVPRRRTRHPGDRRRGGDTHRRTALDAGRRRVGRRRCCPSPRSSRCSRTARCSCARRSTNRWESSISRRWRAKPPSSRPRPVAFRRLSRTAKPACSYRSNRRPTAPAHRSTRTGSSPISRRRSPRWSPIRRGPRRWDVPGAAGRSSISRGRPSPSGRWTSTAAPVAVIRRLNHRYRTVRTTR